MKKFFRDFFYVPKHGKISDKAMLFRAGLSLAIIILCLATMSICAYAYFSCNVASGITIIKGATFDVKVSVQIQDSTGDFVNVEKIGRAYVAELKGSVDYYITLRHAEQSTSKSGFVIITAENSENRYHSQQLGKKHDGTTETISFWMKCNNDTKVNFYPHWGTSSHYGFPVENTELYILDEENVTLYIKTDPPPKPNSDISENNSDSDSSVTDTDSIEDSSENTAVSDSVTTDTGAPDNTTDVLEDATTDTDFVANTSESISISDPSTTDSETVAPSSETAN